MSFFSELKRRHVIRVSGVYIIVGWLLLQVAGSLESAMALPAWFDGFVLAALLIGFPLAAILAWAFELTPEGVKRTAEVDTEESMTTRTGLLDKFLIVTLLLFTAAVVVPKFLPDNGEPTASSEGSIDTSMPGEGEVSASADPSIAVLAFDDMSPEGTEEYFADGVAEEILNLLAKTEGLKVAARTSSFAFKGSSDSIGEIGRKLQVAHVLEGSVRRAGDTIRITAQLIDSDSGYHLWSETYDRKLENIFTIQDEIAANIQAALKSAILGDDFQPAAIQRYRSHNIDAYNAYLMGKELLARRTLEDIKGAIEQFERAIAIEPEFALSHAWAARAWMLLEGREFESLDKAAVDVEVLPLLDAANALAPDNAEVLAITGLHQRIRFRYERALQSLNRAIALNPNFAEAYVWRAASYERKGDYQAMLADRERAYRLDPVSIETARSLVWAYGNYQRYDDAEEIVETIEALHPGHRQVLGMRLNLLFVQGHLGEYASLVESALHRFEDDEELAQSREMLLVHLDLLERVAGSEYPTVQRALAIAEGDAAREREVLDAAASTDWEMHWQYRHGTLDGLAAAVEKYIAHLEQQGRPWAESCDTTHALFFREVGKTESFNSIMTQCQQEYEPGIAAGYLCDCQWLNLVQYTVLTGDFDSAIERLEEWLNKGFSNNLLESNEVLSLLSEYRDYEKLMKKNQENVARQREIYLTQS